VGERGKEDGGAEGWKRGGEKMGRERKPR